MINSLPTNENRNSIAPSMLSIDTWIRLAEYQDYPHKKGLQRFDSQAAEEIVSHFYSLQSRLKRAFVGVPIYVGHPDDPDFQGQSGHTDTKAYGWVDALEAREDGLWMYPKWSSAGKELLNNAYYRFTSPRWALKPLGQGVFRPVRLISIGLTNQPNLQCDAICNQKDLEALYGLESLTEAFSLSELDHLPDPIGQKIKELLSSFDEERAHWIQERQSLESKLQKLECAANQAQQSFKTTLNTESITHNLRKKESPNSSQAHLLNEVKSTMANSGKDYLSAWNLVKQSAL